MSDSKQRIEAVLGPNGAIASRLEDYELRPQQLDMARAVLDTLERGRHLIVEAGTGTGKTLAYLIPALLSGKRVIVSTGSKTKTPTYAKKPSTSPRVSSQTRTGLALRPSKRLGAGFKTYRPRCCPRW